MAIQLNFTTDQDINLPETYWRITEIRIGLISSHANCYFTGYKDKAARDAGKQSIGVKEYAVNGEEFKKFYVKMMDKELNLAEVFYSIAKTRKEIVTGYTTKEITKEVEKVTTVVDEETGENVEEVTVETVTETVNDQPIMVSFFDGAEDV
jgi:hypothetical protein